jgi:3-hydroxyisobutyrate dehydrogenase
LATLATGFIGLGKMGIPMVRNLLKAGVAVAGFDRLPQAAQALKGEPGYRAAATAADAAAADTLILMLPDSTVVDELLWAQGLAQQLRPGQVVIDMGSSDPVRSRDNAERLGALGVGFVDAPVSGGVRRAVDASLAIMMGGEAQSIERVKPLLQCLGKTLVHVGASGAGHAVKALNNYVSAAGLLAVCEALSAAQAFGIDPHLVNQVFNASTGKNNTTEHKVESFMLSHTYASGFAMALMRKDLQTAQGFIERMGTPGEFANECTKTWALAEQSLAPGADHTAMYQYIRAQSVQAG